MKVVALFTDSTIASTNSGVYFAGCGGGAWMTYLEQK